MNQLLRIALGIVRFMAALVDDDYDAYVRRRRAEHPNLPLLTYEEFVVLRGVGFRLRP